MSLGSRTAKGGAKGAGAAKSESKDKPKADKPQPKEKVKPQATTEQLRMANMIDRKNEDASDVRRMVLELMEMTCRTEEEVCSALHDCDNDMVAACNLLLEDTQRIQGEWQTSEKKKKKPPATVTNNGEPEPPADPRSRSGPRSRRGEGEGRGRGAPRGRGARGAVRGGRGGRRGGAPRPRPSRAETNWDDPTDTGGNSGDSFPTTEDWDNEEWSGSLSDTKVFTPSANAQAINDVEQSNDSQEDWDTPEVNNGPTGHIPTYIYNSAHATHAYAMMDQMTAAPPAEPAAPQEVYHATHHQPMGMSGTLTAAQSQYLSQLTQQSQMSQQTQLSQPALSQPQLSQTQLSQTQLSQTQLSQTQLSQTQLSQTQMSQTQMSQTQMSQPRHEATVYAPSAYTTSNYNVYGSAEIAQRKPQRARVPPPSKIPSSAVEMPGGGDSSGAMFLDVQFGALEPDTLNDTPVQTNTNKPPVPVPSQPEPAPAPPVHEPPAEQPQVSYTTNNTVLPESLSVVETTPTSQPVVADPIVTNSTTALEKQLTASMKQLAVSVSEATASVAAPVTATPSQHHYTQHRPKPATVGQQNVYAHHAVSHHPAAVYGASVYAPPVNSTNASLTAASALPANYPPSVTLTQYQPIINSYQQTSAPATVYGGSALYTAAPYAPYQPQPQPKQPTKDLTQQYETPTPSTSSLTNTSTTSQQSIAKAAPSTASSNTATAYASALYGTNSATYGYDEQLMRSQLPHHMGGYYEVGYGVSGAREGTFGLGAGERFGRTDAASPQQVPAAALPPGYAYFYQPPPTTYQYGAVYPTYGGGSNVTGVGGVGGAAAGKLSSYGPQQPYDADSYKQAGPYNANATKTAGGAATDLTGNMYAKTHVALNKVNSYEKAGFHSGTPPPFGAGSHLYIPAPPHHHPHHHAPQHQMDVRVNSSHNRRQENQGGGRSAASKPPATKPAYSQSYWAPN